MSWNLRLHSLVFVVYFHLHSPSRITLRALCMFFLCLCTHTAASPKRKHTPKSQYVVNSIYCTRWAFLTELIWFNVMPRCPCSSVSLNAEVCSSKLISEANCGPFITVQHLKIHTASAHTRNKRPKQNTHSSHKDFHSYHTLSLPQRKGGLIAARYVCAFVCVCAGGIWYCATAGVVLVLLLSKC